MIPIVMALLIGAPAEQPARPIRHEQLTVKQGRVVPGVGLSTYAVITSNPKADRQDAEAIMDVKITWPRAMQTKDAALFNRILSQSFTFQMVGFTREMPISVIAWNVPRQLRQQGTRTSSCRSSGQWPS